MAEAPQQPLPLPLGQERSRSVRQNRASAPTSGILSLDPEMESYLLGVLLWTLNSENCHHCRGSETGRPRLRSEPPVAPTPRNRYREKY